MRIGAIILGLTVLAVGATAVLGKWVLSVMEMILGSGYEGRLVSYYGAFIIIVLGGGFYALANLMYYALVIMRRQKAIFTVYLAAAAAAAVSSGFLVSKFGINGAAGCYLLLMIGLVIGFGLYTAGAYQVRAQQCPPFCGSRISATGTRLLGSQQEEPFSGAGRRYLPLRRNSGCRFLL